MSHMHLGSRVVLGIIRSESPKFDFECTPLPTPPSAGVWRRVGVYCLMCRVIFTHVQVMFPQSARSARPRRGQPAPLQQHLEHAAHTAACASWRAASGERRHRTHLCAQGRHTAQREAVPSRYTYFRVRGFKTTHPAGSTGFELCGPFTCRCAPRRPPRFAASSKACEDSCVIGRMGLVSARG